MSSNICHNLPQTKLIRERGADRHTRHIKKQHKRKKLQEMQSVRVTERKLSKLVGMCVDVSVCVPCVKCSYRCRQTAQSGADEQGE